jgi:putative membrane protein
MFQSALTIILGFGIPAAAQNLSRQDQEFVNKVAKGGMTEVHMGRLGLERGSSAATKAFAQRIVDDHTKANDQLKDLAAKKGVQLPAAEEKPLPLEKKSGAGFDKAYAKAMVEDHKKDIAEFEKEAKSGTDPDLKKWAKDTLPTLQGHLMQAEALR